MKYTRIFEPGRIGCLQLKNRIVMPAMHLTYSEDGTATEQFKEFYYRRAEGGAGLIICGGCRFDEYGGAPGMISLENDRFIPGFREFTDGMHVRGAKVVVQLYHGGRYVRKAFLPEGSAALSASATTSAFTHEQAKEMSIEEMHTVIRKWAEAAVRAKKAGFDAVEILGSAGYLICQFLSPVTNLRTDKYGGSWENRTRFPMEVFAAIREAVGSDYPLILRIAGNDFIPGSNTNTEAVAFAKLAESAGIDMLNVTGGWHETVVPQLPGEVPFGSFVYLAEAVRQAVSIPVMACNRLNTPSVCEEVLAQGKADLVGLCRPLLADPDWPKKAFEERDSEIRPCVGCNQACLGHTFFGQPVGCLVNPEAGQEYRIRKDRRPLAEVPKKILVIGAGPAGAEFAVRARLRGADVTVWEKKTVSGGQLSAAKTPPGREGFGDLQTYHKIMMEKTGVNVRYGREVAAEDIPSEFDEIVIATGAAPVSGDFIPNDGSVPVETAERVLSGMVIPGKNVMIVGGGAVGCETALFLARKSTVSPEQYYFLSANKAENTESLQKLLNRMSRRIGIIEIEKRIGNGFEKGCAWPILNELKRLGVKSYVLAAAEKIEKGKLFFRQKSGDGEEIKETACDMVVIAVGYSSEDSLYQELKGRKNVHLIGDARKTGKVEDAIRQAYELADLIV